MARILIVEDNELNRDMLTRRLQRRGHAISCAVNGLEGVQMAFDEHPDLILLDMSLPVLDGWEAASRIKQDPATRAIPVIALTAHALPEDRARALSAGCDDYDTKPIDLVRLLHKISARLSAAGSGHLEEKL